MSDRSMAICRDCSDDDFTGYVCAIPFSSTVERRQWVRAHIVATGHLVLEIGGFWLSPHDASALGRDFDWEAGARGETVTPNLGVCTDLHAEVELLHRT